MPETILIIYTVMFILSFIFFFWKLTEGQGKINSHNYSMMVIFCMFISAIWFITLLWYWKAGKDRCLGSFDNKGDENGNE